MKNYAGSDKHDDPVIKWSNSKLMKVGNDVKLSTLASATMLNYWLKMSSAKTVNPRSLSSIHNDVTIFLDSTKRSESPLLSHQVNKRANFTLLAWSGSEMLHQSCCYLRRTVCTFHESFTFVVQTVSKGRTIVCLYGPCTRQCHSARQMSYSPKMIQNFNNAWCRLIRPQPPPCTSRSVHTTIG